MSKMSTVIELLTLIMSEQSEHSELIVCICVYIDSTQLSYEIMFNSNKNLLLSYSYYTRNAASISSPCIQIFLLLLFD